MFLYFGAVLFLYAMRKISEDANQGIALLRASNAIEKINRGQERKKTYLHGSLPLLFLCFPKYEDDG